MPFLSVQGLWTVRLLQSFLYMRLQPVLFTHFSKKGHEHSMFSRRSIIIGVFLLLPLNVHAVDSCRSVFDDTPSFRPSVIELTPYTSKVSGRSFRRFSAEVNPGIKVIVLKDANSLSLMNRLRGYRFMASVMFKKGGKLVRDSDQRKIERDPSINCHGYVCAINNIPGVPDGWINNDPEEITNGTDPLEIILRNFFEPIKELGAADEASIFTDTSLQNGDLVSYIDEQSRVHSGFIYQEQTRLGVRNWIRSKLGYAGAFDFPPEKMNTVYSYSRIEIWRRKPAP